MIFPHETQDKVEHATFVGQTLRDGEYQVQRIIGQGKLGRVFLAMHTTLMIPLALKQMPADLPLAQNVVTELDSILHDEDSIGFIAPTPRPQEEGDLASYEGSATDRFAHEALFLARLQHSAIPTLYDYFREDDYWYLVMDYIPGYTLHKYLLQHAPLPVLEALNCALQICDALDYLHTQTPPVLLRKLNADTIRVTPEGILMLANLNLTNITQHSQLQKTQDHTQRIADEATQNPKDTTTQTHAHTEHHPDTIQLEITHDLYSLGILLHDMLYGQTIKPNAPALKQTNHKPPQNNTLTPTDPDTQQHDAQNTASLPSVPYISTFLKSVLRLATRADAVDRFQSAQTFYLALERAYQIEEQRTFQHHLVQLSQQEEGKTTDNGASADYEQKKLTPNEQVTANWDQGRQDTPPIIISHTLELEQRRITRAALQRARWERLEQEQIEAQLALVDESLEQRAHTSHSQISLQAIAQAEAPTVAVPARQHFQHIIKVNFLLALVLCLIMASLLIYVHVAQPLANSMYTLVQRSMQVIGNTQIAQKTQYAQNNQSTQSVGNTESANSTDGNLTDNYWQALPSLPAAEADNSMVYVELQGRAYVYMNGGYHSSPPSALYDHNLYRYDIQAAHWETININHFPGMVNNAAAVDEQGHIFFTGGYSSDTYTVTSSLYIYDPGTDSLQKIVPPAQMPLGFGGSIYADRQGHLYITQGFSRPGDPHAQAGTGWYRYDIASAQWNQLATLPVGLGYVFTASDNNGGILLLGGASDAGQHNATNKIYRYDIATDSWTQTIDSLPQTISGAAGCQVWPGQLVMIGGYNTTYNAGNRSAWIIDLQTLKWRALVDLTIGGSVLGAAACDGKGHIFLERGTSTPRLPTNDYWEMVVAPGIKIDD